jgi:hypothetical protein
MKIFTAVIIVFFMAIAPVFGQLEADSPQMDQQFSMEKEKRIAALETMDLHSALEVLASPAFLSEEEYLDEAIYRAFKNRTEEVIEYMMKVVQSTKSAQNNEGVDNLYLAKRIFQIFPDASLNRLIDLYMNTGPEIRANVIYIVGDMDGGKAIDALLIEALYDTSVCREATGESLGEPLRICDMAYNQLVIRYSMKNVLRTIGTGHSINVRDYHIGELQNRF